MLQAAADGRVKVEEVFVLADRRSALPELEGVSITVVSQAVLGKLAGTANPRGPVATLAIPEASRTDGDVVLLEVGEPGNAGTLVRSAAAFGFAVAALPGCVDLWSPKVLRAAAGAHFLTPVVQGDVMASHQVWSTVVSDGVDPIEIEQHLDGRSIAIVIGDEAHGVGRDAAAAAEVAMSIPTSESVESLNAAVAGSIAMYEMARVRARLRS